MIELFLWCGWLGLHAIVVCKSFWPYHRRVLAKVWANQVIIVLKIYLDVRLLYLDSWWRDIDFKTLWVKAAWWNLLICLDSDFDFGSISKRWPSVLPLLVRECSSVILSFVRRREFNLLTLIAPSWLLKLLFGSFRDFNDILLFVVLRAVWFCQILFRSYTLIQILQVFHAFLESHLIIHFSGQLASVYPMHWSTSLFVVLPVVCSRVIVLMTLRGIGIFLHQLRNRGKQWERWMISGSLLVHRFKVLELLFKYPLLSLAALLTPHRRVIAAVNTSFVSKSDDVFLAFLMGWGSYLSWISLHTSCSSGIVSFRLTA